MEPFFIVDLIQESGYVFHDVLVGLVVVEINLFVFHRFDEALRLGVVVRVASAAHRSAQAPFDQHLPVSRRTVLAAAVGVMNATGLWSAIGQRCAQRRECQPVYSNTEMSLNRGNEEESVGFGFEGLKRES